MLEVEGLVKRFGGFTAVKKVSFKVAPGERVYIGVAEVGAVVDRCAPALDRQLHAGAVAELVPVKSEPEAENSCCAF